LNATLQEDLLLIQGYIDNGLTPIPVYPQTKTPCVSWEQYQNFKPTDCEIKEWCRTFWNPDHWRNNNYWKSKWIQERRKALLREGLTAEQINADPKLTEYDGSISVAILGGKTSGNLAIFDDDAHVLTSYEIDAYKEKTLVMETNSGNHIYLQTFNPISTKDGKNGEIRGEGGYGIAAPSIHPLGKKYKIISTTTKVLKFDSEEKDKAFMDWASEKLKLSVTPTKTTSAINTVLNNGGDNGVFLYGWHKRFAETFFVEDHLNDLSLKLFAISAAKTKADTNTAAEIILHWAEQSHTQKNAPMTVDLEKIKKMIDSAKSLEGTDQALTPMSKVGLKQRYPELYQQLLDNKIIIEQTFTNTNPTSSTETLPALIKVPIDEADEYLVKGYKTKHVTTKEAVLEYKPENISEEPKESQADRMYKLFCEQSNTDLFIDQNKTEFARIPVIQINATNAINDISASNKVPFSQVLEAIAPTDTTDPTRFTCGKSVNSVNSVSEYQRVKEEFLLKLKNAKDEDEIDSIVAENTQYKLKNAPKEIMRLDSKNFRKYLAPLLFEAENKVANNEAISQAIQLLSYDASHGKFYQLYNRVAPDPTIDGSIWLDIADQQNRAYHITKAGWTVETQVPILFKRYEHQQPLAGAIHNGDVKALLPFVNIGAGKDSEITKHRQLLMLVQTASYFIPEIPRPINAMFGCPGSHKTYAQKCIRMIIDNSASPTLRMPRDENAALQILDHHYLPIFDNIFNLPQWFSDMLCSAVTGAGQESRSLYSNDDPFIRAFKRCPLLNGINLPATKGDLLSRTILHPTEPSKDRLTEKELDADFAKMLPSILGGFLDVIVKALNYYGTPQAKPTKIFRLADFTEWGCAIALALEETVPNFTTAMEENLASQNSCDIENNIVAEVFIKYCAENLQIQLATEQKPHLTSPSEVFVVLEAKARVGLGVNTRNTKKWPSIASAFTRKLNDSKNAIIAIGFNYDIYHNGKERVMAIWNINALPEEVKHYCSKECGNYDKHECPKYGNINALTLMPLKCGKPREAS
jgi:hypothetical protein